MLSMLFKEPLSEEQDEFIVKEFYEYPLKYEHDITADVDTKVSIYFGNAHIAEEKLKELKLKGYKFIGQVHHGRAFFHDQFGTAEDSEMPEDEESSEVIPLIKNQVASVPSTPEISDRKPTIRSALDSLAPAGPSQEPAQQYVTVEQFEAMSKRAQDQLNEFSIDLMGRVEAMSATALAATRRAAASSAMFEASATDPVRTTPVSEQFKAKNELIANGIHCEKCGKTVRDVEPITKLIMAVREHVVTHFDSENPRLKRFECRECKDFQTNFVDDFERHLRRHGAMSSMPEKRQKLTVNLLTKTHLELIAKIANECFPEVFEKSPPKINTILAVDTPVRAKVSIFPRLDRLYCSKYNIPYSTTGLPAASIKID